MKLVKELGLAKRLSIEAGKAIMEVYKGSDFDIEYKKDDSPLTKADKRANQIIVSQLKEVFPEYAVLSEESKDDKNRLNNQFCWVVDPLDGTKEFIKRNG
ncbi:MAG: 3'(2'),5'-bisphosphate nucleotidase CysQ family protein, partial [Candidatus Woesearchaeota archaeon]